MSTDQRTQMSAERETSRTFPAGKADGSVRLGSQAYPHNQDMSAVAIHPIEDDPVVAHTEAIGFARRALERDGKPQGMVGREVELELLDEPLLDGQRQLTQLLLGVDGQAVGDHSLSRRSIALADTSPEALEVSSSSANVGERYPNSSFKASRAALSKKSPKVWPFWSTTRTAPLSDALSRSGIALSGRQVSFNRSVLISFNATIGASILSSRVNRR